MLFFNLERSLISVSRTVEVFARSDKSFGDAVSSGIAKAGESIKGMRQAWVDGQKVFIEDGKVAGYQVDLKITFVVD